MLLGADLIVLPTNWPTGAISTAKTLIPARALENHVYYAAVNRVGTERGFRFIGMSRTYLNCVGEFLAVSDDDTPDRSCTPTSIPRRRATSIASSCRASTNCIG